MIYYYWHDGTSRDRKPTVFRNDTFRTEKYKNIYSCAGSNNDNIAFSLNICRSSRRHCSPTIHTGRFNISRNLLYYIYNIVRKSWIQQKITHVRMIVYNIKVCRETITSNRLGTVFVSNVTLRRVNNINMYRRCTIQLGVYFNITRASL